MIRAKCCAVKMLLATLAIRKPEFVNVRVARREERRTKWSEQTINKRAGPQARLVAHSFAKLDTDL